MSQTTKHVPQVGDIWSILSYVHPNLFDKSDDFWFEFHSKDRPPLPDGMAWKLDGVARAKDFPKPIKFNDDGEPTDYELVNFIRVDFRVI